MQRHRHHRVVPAAADQAGHEWSYRLLHDAKISLVLEGMDEFLPHPLVPQGSPRGLEPEILISALVAPVGPEGCRRPAPAAEGTPHEGQSLEAPPAQNVARTPVAAHTPLRIVKVGKNIDVGPVQSCSSSGIGYSDLAPG